MNPRIDWWNADFGEEEQRLAVQAIGDNYLNEGPRTRAFEAAMAKRLGVKHAHALPNGTMALYIALKAMGVGHGDEVIVPA